MPLSTSGKIAITFSLGMLAGAGIVNYLYIGNPFPGLDRATPARSAAPNKAQAVSPKSVAEDIKKGGYILYFRHPQRQKWDSVIAFDVFELATGANAADATYRDAVCLTTQGKEEAKIIGKIFELAKVPVGAVASSPSCRARQGAELAFGKTGAPSVGLAHTPVTNKDNAAAFSADLKRVLTTITIEPGKNAVIMAHGNTLENHPHLFSDGADYLRGPAITETGFFVIKREPDGKLRIVYRFANLGDFAANAITLQIN